jgi:hypothetical protein
MKARRSTPSHFAENPERCFGFRSTVRRGWPLPTLGGRTVTAAGWLPGSRSAHTTYNTLAIQSIHMRLAIADTPSGIQLHASLWNSEHNPDE